jgi:hypothetical protein
MSSRPSPALVYAAQRAVQSDFFLAGALRQYQDLHQFNEQELARDLSCAPEDLPRLALCRRPSGTSEDFMDDVERLARRFHLKSERLVALIRQTEAIEALQTYMARSLHINRL